MYTVNKKWNYSLILFRLRGLLIQEFGGGIDVRAGFIFLSLKQYPNMDWNLLCYSLLSDEFDSYWES